MSSKAPATSGGFFVVELKVSNQTLLTNPVSMINWNHTNKKGGERICLSPTL